MLSVIDHSSNQVGLSNPTLTGRRSMTAELHHHWGHDLEYRALSSGGPLVQ
jgi:hypothetical protein